MIDKQLFL